MATARIMKNGINSGMKKAHGTANRATEKAFTNDNAVKVSGVIFIPADFNVLSKRDFLYLSIGIILPSFAAMPSIIASMDFDSFLSFLPVFITAWEVLR